MIIPYFFFLELFDEAFDRCDSAFDFVEVFELFESCLLGLKLLSSTFSTFKNTLLVGLFGTSNC